MFYDYPPIQEDELYFSYLLRYHIYTGNTSVVYSIREILGVQTWNSNVSFISHVGDSLRKIGLEEEVYLEEHSVFPFYRMFLDLEKYQRMKRLIMQNSSISYMNKLHPAFHKEDSLAGHALKYCPICHRKKKTYSDIQIYHQIPWVNVCEEHRCYLKEVSTLQKKQLTCPEKWDVTFQKCEEDWLLSIAEDIKFILEKRPKLYLEDVRKLIRKKFQKMQETKKIEIIEEKIRSQYEMLPTIYQCYRKRFSLEKFLEISIKQDISQMEYLIFIRILFGSFKKFIEE